MSKKKIIGRFKKLYANCGGDKKSNTMTRCCSINCLAISHLFQEEENEEESVQVLGLVKEPL
ncbi:hypothetical protein TSUD_136880 [Trifolium subterraneum]|uniref:Uncharacterized protein n=1 Tax=Trifolium subterraneum TaxID=3900 RepID=A0A2Z6P1K4_TRISU|nr:hypothetical protein TSUD_136880 [Trifolium subterraneum]